MAHLIYETPLHALEPALHDPSQAPAGHAPSKVLAYLKTLGPPAVDLELRALCTHDEDEEGVQLVGFLLDWFRQRASLGADFELLEAYLHRALLIHGDLIMRNAQLREVLAGLSAAHEKSSDRFRELVQRNLCVLKLVSGLAM